MSGHAETVTFDVGGKHYKVSRSLIERFPDTILARMTSELWLGGNKAKDEPIFIERDGERFRYCLDYMRDGRVSVPITASKDGIVKDLEYYGFEGVDSTAIEVCGTSRAATGRVFLDARRKLGEMRLKAVCIRVADLCVAGFLNSPCYLKVELSSLEPYYNRAYQFDGSDYLQSDTWKNKGKDLVNEDLTEFGLHASSFLLVPKGTLTICVEQLKEKA